MIQPQQESRFAYDRHGVKIDLTWGDSDQPAAERLDGMTAIVWEMLYQRASRDAPTSK